MAICFIQMRSGHQSAIKGATTNCMAHRTDSTEDLWNEDSYIPETYLPTPEYFVNVTPVQPDYDPHLRQN